MTVMSGGKILVRALRANDIEYVFGTSGSTFAEVLDSLAATKIKFILALHESCAIGMADGYARATGKPGFVIVTDTPGTANIIGGLSNARPDGTPIVVVAGNRDTFIPSINTPNETYELVEITKPFTKWSWLVTKTEYLDETLSRAFYIASSPPTGPVFLGVPQDVLDGRIEWKNTRTRRANCYQQISGDPVMIATAASLLLRARNPVLVAGSEVKRSGAIAELKALAELIAARVVLEPYVSFSSFPSNSMYYFGGHLRNPKPVERADVLLGAGCRLFLDKGHTFVPPISKRTKIIHLHEGPWEIARAYPTELGIICNVRTGLRDIIQGISKRITEKHKSVIRKRSEAIRREKNRINDFHSKALRAGREERSSIKPLTLFSEMKERLPHDVVVVDEAVTMSNNILTFLDLNDPDSYFSRSGMYLGWGLPAALGIKLAFPEKNVIACLGDGSFTFSLQALWTASRYRIPVKVVIFNNRGYRAIREVLKRTSKTSKQGNFFVGSDIVDPEIDFSKVAEGFDVYAKRVSTPGEIGLAIEELVHLKKPGILDVIIDRE